MEIDELQMFIEKASANPHEDNLKQNITYIIGKERSEGNIDAISPLYIYRMLNEPVEVGDCLWCVSKNNITQN